MDVIAKIWTTIVDLKSVVNTLFYIPRGLRLSAFSKMRFYLSPSNAHPSDLKKRFMRTEMLFMLGLPVEDASRLGRLNAAAPRS
jgi:hypothetical protein